MAFSLVKTVTKLSLAGGAVYWSIEQGIWGNMDTGSRAGKRLTSMISPAANDYLSKIPSIDSVNDQALENWNKGILTIFKTISELPEISAEYLGKAQETINKELKGLDANKSEELPKSVEKKSK